MARGCPVSPVPADIRPPGLSAIGVVGALSLLNRSLGREAPTSSMATSPAEDAATLAKALVGHLGGALVVTPRRGPVLHVNPAAERLLGDSEVLCLRAGVLHTRREADRPRLQVFLDRRDLGDPSYLNARLVLVGPSGRLVTLRTLAGSVAAALLGPVPQDAVTLLIHEPRLIGPTARQRVNAAQAVFNWTGREADLVEQLLLGRVVKEAATAMGISVSNARQRLKEVFAKAGVDSQAHLIALMADIA